MKIEIIGLPIGSVVDGGVLQHRHGN